MSISARIPGLAAVLLAGAVMAGSGGAFAQVDCAGLTQPGRDRCEQDKQVAKACAGRTGEALAVCRRAVLEPRSEKRDCSRFAEGYGRNKCEDANLHDEIEMRCGAMTGDDLQRCYGEVMAKALRR